MGSVKRFKWKLLPHSIWPFTFAVRMRKFGEREKKKIFSSSFNKRKKQKQTSYQNIMLKRMNFIKQYTCLTFVSLNCKMISCFAMHIFTLVFRFVSVTHNNVFLFLKFFNIVMFTECVNYMRKVLFPQKQKWY